MVWIVPWVGKLLLWCGGSRICSEGGGPYWALFCFGELNCLALGR
jgi:hypothetical protein